MQWSANAALCQWLGYDIIKRLQSVDIALLMLVIKIAAERPCSGTDERARPSIRAQRAQRGTGCGTEQGRASGAAAGGGAAAGQSPGADCQRSDQSCSKQGGFNHRCCNREEADRRGDRQSRRWDAVRERHQVGHCERYPCDSACGLAGQRPKAKDTASDSERKSTGRDRHSRGAKQMHWAAYSVRPLRASQASTDNLPGPKATMTNRKVPQAKWSLIAAGQANPNNAG